MPIAKKARQLLMLPVWLLQIFTQAKSFSKNKVLGNVWLNRLGLHVFRMVLAHSVMRARMLMLSRGLDKKYREAYFKDGFVLIQDFLGVDEYSALKQEILSADAEVRECTQGDTLTHRIMLDKSSMPGLPLSETFIANPKLRKLLKFASGVNSQPVSYIQTIKNHFVEGPADPQKNLHSDTFHPTMKSWYFLDDVDERNGPFTYVPGSHRLSRARLRWEYKKSIAICNNEDRYSGNGSLRLSETDSKEMGLQPAHGFKVPANTLVIANTHGFHCRGQASERSTRTELWTISRSNPFNPFPGIDHPAITHVQNSALNAWRRYCDRKAEGRGTVSSWHVIDARNTIGEELQASQQQPAAAQENRQRSAA